MKNKINLVIPMAGEGRRFSEAGFKRKKPFIEVAGRMMIERVLESFSSINCDIYLVVQESFLSEYESELIKIKKQFNVQFVEVQGITRGAACTVLAAYPHILNDLPVLFADSDNLFGDGVISQFLEDSLKRNLGCSLVTFPSKEECFSYAQIDANKKLLCVKEKQVVSNDAVSGAYYFASGMSFVDSAIKMLIYGETSRGEFYMSDAFNSFLKNGGEGGVYRVTQKDFSCLGTPSQLKDYLSEKR